MKQVKQAIIIFVVVIILSAAGYYFQTQKQIKLNNIVVVPEIEFEDIEIFIRFSSEGKEKITYYKTKTDFDYNKDVSKIPEITSDEITNIKAYEALLETPAPEIAEENE